MRGNRVRLLLAVGCAVVAVGLTGCFQTAGDSLDATSVAIGIFTHTPTPQDVIEEETPTPEEVAQVFDTETPTLAIDFLPTATETPTDGMLAFVTATPTPTIEIFFADTPTPPDQAASIGNGDQPQQDQPSEAALTATAILERATQSYIMTLTATAEVFMPTPTFEGGGGGDFFFPTATPGIIAPPVVQPPVAGGTCTHVVATRENLFRIALRYGSTVESIAAANGIANVNVIKVGQTLTIPNCYGGGVTPLPGGGIGQPYVVRTGDTLYRIAITYGSTVEAIAANNPSVITNINLIYIGQTIYIP